MIGALPRLAASLVAASLLAGCASLSPPPQSDSTARLKAHAEHIADVRERCSGSVALLFSLRGGQAGSAIIVGTNGLFFTAGHVLEEAGRDFIAYLPDRRTANARALYVDKTRDFGVGRLDGGPWEPVAVRQRLPEPGEWVVTLGYPDGFGNGQTPSVRAGKVRFLAGPDKHPWFTLTDCPTWKGDSGGPIFDLQGRLIAITSWASLSPAASASVPVANIRIPKAAVDTPKTVGSTMLYQTRVAATAVPDHIRLSKLPFLGHQFGWNRRPERRFTRQATSASAPPGAAEAVVECLQDKSVLCLGTLISPTGLVITKDSEVHRRVNRVRLADGRVFPAKRIARDGPSDLAVLKLEQAENLPFLNLEQTERPPPAGHFLISPLPSGEQCLGVLAKPPHLRETADEVRPPKLVVVVTEVQQGLLIDSITPEAARSTLGLELGDIVARVGEVEQPDRSAFRDIMRDVLNDREPVRAIIYRNGEALKVSLGNFKKPPPQAVRRMSNGFIEWMAGPISERHKQLDGTFRHDTVLWPNECGGPIFDLDGNWVGLNIARAGRDRTLAWSLDVVARRIQQLLAEEEN